MKTALVNKGEVYMIRGLLKLVLLVIVLVGLFAFLVGRRSSSWEILPGSSPSANSGPVDTSKARDAGAKVGEATANVANQGRTAVAAMIGPAATSFFLRASTLRF